MAITAPSKPEPPVHLPPNAQKAWMGKYDAAFKQAVIDYPENPAAQRRTALKAANALLAVPEPASIADVEKLEPWQILNDQTMTVKGVPTRFVITSDGRKYRFPVPVEEPAKAPKSGK